MKIKDFYMKNLNSIYLIIIFIFCFLIVYWKVLSQSEFGPLWDTFDFLSNAMYFAGHGFGYVDYTRPPFFSFVTSMIFRLGYISELTIYLIDGSFFIFGVVGLYLFFKLRFTSFQSFFGCLLFMTFPIVLYYVSVGLSDIPAISLSIWSLFFTVLAIKRNSKFFYLSFPFFILAFLTRYSIALIIFPMIFYIFINRKKVNYKNLLLGMILSIFVLIPVLIFFFQKFGNPIFPFIVFFGFTQNSVLPISLTHVPLHYNANIPVYVMGEAVNSPENPSYANDLLLFVKNFPFYVGSSSFAIFIISSIGIFIYGIMVIEKSIKLRMLVDNKVKFFLYTILIILFIITFGQINYLISEVLFLVLGFTSYMILKKYNFRNLDIDFLFIVWLMSFFIFNSIYVIKDHRYFLAMAPPVAYFLIRGFFYVVDQFQWEYKNFNLIKLGLSIIIIIVILFSTTFYLLEIYDSNLNETSINYDIHAASNWFKNYEPNYRNKVIYADYWPYFSWYLKTNVKAMPAFRNDKIYYYRLKDYNVDSSTNNLYNKELNDNNVDYYLSDIRDLNLTFYRPIKQFGQIIIYERVN